MQPYDYVQLHLVAMPVKEDGVVQPIYCALVKEPDV